MRPILTNRARICPITIWSKTGCADIATVLLEARKTRRGRAGLAR